VSGLLGGIEAEVVEEVVVVQSGCAVEAVHDGDDVDIDVVVVVVVVVAGENGKVGGCSVGYVAGCIFR
jgi:hypothetical protein